MQQKPYIIIIPYKKLSILSFILINIFTALLILLNFLEYSEKAFVFKIFVIIIDLILLLPFAWFGFFFSLAYVSMDDQGIIEKTFFGNTSHNISYDRIKRIRILNTGYSFGKAIEISYIDTNGKKKFLMLHIYKSEIIDFLKERYDGEIVIHPSMFSSKR